MFRAAAVNIDELCEVLQQNKDRIQSLEWSYDREILDGSMYKTFLPSPESTLTITLTLLEQPEAEPAVEQPQKAACADCGGTGVYRGFNATEPCRTCGGSG